MGQPWLLPIEIYGIILNHKAKWPQRKNMSMSDYLEGKLIGVTYNGGTFTAPTNFYLALYTGTGPTESDASVNELSGGGYARVEWFPDTAVTPEWVVSNDADITFAEATADWSIINHVGIIDNLGNLLDYGPITTPRTILTGGVFKVLTGELDIQYT